MWSHDTDDAVAEAKAWESAHRAEARAARVPLPDIAGSVERACAEALANRSANLGWAVFGSLVLTGVGFVGRARPSIPVRIVRK
ncbi:hypothetical protein GS575_07190 [Rhodococcus hoagii]|nr:hypothetical protein [Prescottella equi]